MSPNSAIDNVTAPTSPERPAPFARLVFCLFAAPLAWALHLLVNNSIAGENCSGAAVSDAASHRWSQAIWAIYVIDAIAVGLSIAACYVAYELWKSSTQERTGDAHRSVHSGEGRTRFLALWAMLTSILFGFAILADALGVFVGPTC